MKGWQVRRIGLMLVGLALAALAACSPPAAPAQVAEAPGTIELNQTPPRTDALLGGGGFGTVLFRGRMYHFAIGGLGVDGSAIAILQTTGEVHGLRDIEQFEGTYRQAPADTALPSMAAGGLWLRNQYGTLMRISTPPGGRLPAIGIDAVRVVLD